MERSPRYIITWKKQDRQRTTLVLCYLCVKRDKCVCEYIYIFQERHLRNITGCLLVEELSNWKLSIRGTLFTVGPLLLKFMEILPIWKEMLIDTRYSKEVRFSMCGYWWEGAAQRGEELEQSCGGKSSPPGLGRWECSQTDLRATFQSAGAWSRSQV